MNLGSHSPRYTSATTGNFYLFAHFFTDRSGLGLDGQAIRAKNHDMLTVIIPISGEHRSQWLEQAIESVPFDTPQIDEVLLVHQGGPWSWGDGLRRRLADQPKLRVVEYSDRMDFVGNFNRSIAESRSRWVMLLPDDDFLLRDVFARAIEKADDALSSDAGLISFGWYYLKHDRYLPDYLRRHEAPFLQRFTPKLCATLINTRHFGSIGGFSADYGGFCDTVLFARLIHEFNAWRAPTPVAVYRLHQQQESARVQQVYTPYYYATVRGLSTAIRSEDERELLERRLRAFLDSHRSVLPRAADRLLTRLRGSREPRATRQGELEQLIAG